MIYFLIKKFSPLSNGTKHTTPNLNGIAFSEIPFSQLSANKKPSLPDHPFITTAIAMMNYNEHIYIDRFVILLLFQKERERIIERPRN